MDGHGQTYIPPPLAGIKTESENSVDPDGAAHNDLHCLPSYL